MDILTEQDKELLRTHGKGLEMLRHQISHLSAEYSIKGSELLQVDKNDYRGVKMMGISNNLTFGCESIDDASMKFRYLRVELKRAKDKIYDQMVKIDKQNEEIKRLKKLTENLKMNINL
jgi:hypothetical protein